MQTRGKQPAEENKRVRSNRSQERRISQEDRGGRQGQRTRRVRQHPGSPQDSHHVDRTGNTLVCIRISELGKQDINRSAGTIEVNSEVKNRHTLPQPVTRGFWLISSIRPSRQR